MDKNKVLYLNSASINTKELSEGEETALFIEGYASTNDIDRMGDVIQSGAWEKGLENYLKNPIILAYHDHDDPIGRMVDHKIDYKGLWIKARISQAAEEVYNLIKDGVLTALSVGFRIKDAEYNTLADVFVIKEVELMEISVVSVPANQNTLFNLSKAFTTADDYKNFRMQFAPSGESAKGLESTQEAKSDEHKEWNMDPKQLQEMLDAASKKAASDATNAILAAQAEKAAKEEAEKKAQEALEAKIKATVEATVKTIDNGAERLLQEISKRLEQQEEKSKAVLDGLESVLKEKAEELIKMNASKMTFTDSKGAAGSTYEERETAFLLSKLSGKSLDNLKYGKEILEKTGAHVPSATWELEVSTNMENEVRRKLVVSPIFRSIQMQTNVMTLPVNPEAGYATWVTNAQFGTDDSSGAAQTHALKEITLNAYKVATREYLAYEEEEDSLLALLPVVRDAMVRRTARSVDKAMLRGAGAGADPVKGIVTYDASSAVETAVGSAISVTDLRALRKDLGAWGLNPGELIFIVSTDAYYDLLEDQNFQTMDKVGSNATLLTGQIGSVGNTPVIVSAEFDTKGIGAAAVVAIHPGNFLVGNQRGMRFETDTLVETQRKVLVASLRTGLTQVTTNLGGAVSVLRWKA